MGFGGFFGLGNSASESSTNNTTNNYDQRVINETSNANDGQFAGNSGDVQYTITDDEAVKNALISNTETQRAALNANQGVIERSYDSIDHALETAAGESYAFASKALDAIGKTQEQEAIKLRESLQGLGELSSNVATQGISEGYSQLSKTMTIGLVVMAALMLYRGKMA